MPGPPSGRVRKNDRVDPKLIPRAQSILGTATATATETIEQPRDIVAFQREVQDGIRAIAGQRLWTDVFQDGTAGPE